MPGGQRLSQEDGYFALSQRPLHALVILLPLIVAYEWGAAVWLSSMQGGGLAARTWIQGFLEAFGAAGYYLPGAVVVGVLLCWHAASKDPWKLEPAIYPIMLIESLAVALPILVLCLLALGRPMPMMESWQAEVFLSLGAGVYEEMVFRLAAIAFLHFLMVDALKAPQKAGAAVAIVGSSLLFAAAHFPSVQAFDWPLAIFYFVAGLYLAVIYLLRGFGIVATAHAFYDVLINVMAHTGSSASPPGA